MQKDWRHVQTSEVRPSKIVTSELGISHAWEVKVVEISIGSGPIKHIQRVLYFMVGIKDNTKRGQENRGNTFNANVNLPVDTPM